MLADELALSLTSYLKKEREYVPLKSALDNMAYFATQFSTYDSVNGSTDYYSTYKVILHMKTCLSKVQTGCSLQFLKTFFLAMFPFMLK